MSNEDDAYGGKVPNKYKKVVLDGDISDYELTYPSDWYKIDGKKLKPNMERVEEEAEKEEVARKEQEKEKKIQAKIREMAIQQLQAEGKLEVE